MTRKHTNSAIPTQILPGLCLMGTQGTCINRCWSIKLNTYLSTVLNKRQCMVYYLMPPTERAVLSLITSSRYCI